MQKTSIKSLFTREAANRGAKLSLKLPDGTPIPETITIFGQDSDIFATERAKRSRESARILSLPKEDQPAATFEADTELLASLVGGWDFAEPFTPEAVKELLRESPGIREEINRAIADRSLFFVKKP